MFPIHVPTIIAILSIISYEQEMRTYTVKKVEDRSSTSHVWDDGLWSGISPLECTYYMGDKPEHFPKVQAKVAYSDRALFVVFRVKDQFVKAISTKHQDPVYKDSCVEFFFYPKSAHEKGYFNLEMNCSGRMLFHHQRARGESKVVVTPRDISTIAVSHSMPDLIEEEIMEPTTWTVSYRLPFEILSHYQELQVPDSGTIWRANFYKCADGTSHPHWLTWNKVIFDKPNFHLPQYFGRLIFE